MKGLVTLTSRKAQQLGSDSNDAAAIHLDPLFHLSKVMGPTSLFILLYY